MNSLETIRERNAEIVASGRSIIAPTYLEPQVWLGQPTRFPLPFIGDNDTPRGWQRTGRTIIGVPELITARFAPGNAYAVAESTCCTITVYEYERTEFSRRVAA